MSGRWGLGSPTTSAAHTRPSSTGTARGWSPVSSPDPFPNATTSLTAIAAISASDIWAVGFAIENWNGTSWSIVTSPCSRPARGSDGPQRWDRRGGQQSRLHPGELRPPPSARPDAGPKRSSPLRCVRASPRLRSGIAILAVTDAIPVLAVLRALPVILGAVLCPTLRLRAVLLACRASPSPLLYAACAEK